MKKFLPILALALVLSPGIAFGATYSAEQTISLSEPILDNAYLIGVDVNVNSSTGADLGVLGGTITITAPVLGDAFIAGGVTTITEQIEGDLRALSGKIALEQDVEGDILLLGGSVVITGRPTSSFISGINVSILNGSRGPVSVYAVSSTLGGVFDADVSVVASERITLAEGTVINGNFSYNAPEEVVIPDSVTILGDVVYTGASSILPTSEEAKTYATAGTFIFFILRALSLVVLALVLLLCFTSPVNALGKKATGAAPGALFKYGLIGALFLLLTPIAIFILLISFLGIGIALVLLLAYVLLLLIAPALAGLLLASYVREKHAGMHVVRVSHAVAATLAFHVLTLIPYIGGIILFIGVSVVLGILLSSAFVSTQKA